MVAAFFITFIIYCSNSLFTAFILSSARHCSHLWIFIFALKMCSQLCILTKSHLWFVNLLIRPLNMPIFQYVLDVLSLRLAQLKSTKPNAHANTTMKYPDIVYNIHVMFSPAVWCKANKKQVWINRMRKNVMHRRVYDVLTIDKIVAVVAWMHAHSDYTAMLDMRWNVV